MATAEETRRDRRQLLANSTFDTSAPVDFVMEEALEKMKQLDEVLKRERTAKVVRQCIVSFY